MTPELQVGTIAPTRTFGPLTVQDFVRYAGASGDFNPIHYDDAFARAAGYPSVFAQGMYEAALLASSVTDWLGADAIRRFSVRFRDQVWPGDVLTCTGQVTNLYRVDDELRAELALSCTRQTGAIAVAGTAVFVLSPLDPGS
jgi:acyl dehydratase